MYQWRDGAEAGLYRRNEEKSSLKKHLRSELSHMVFEAEVIGLTLVAELVCKKRMVRALH